MKKIPLFLLIVSFCVGTAYSRLQVKKPVQKRILAVKTIKLQYPNGGEIWEKGKPYTIRWQSQGIGSYVRIKLKWGTGSGGWLTVTNKTPNSGSYRYSVPSTGIGPSGSQFWIYVMTLDESVKDMSDKAFTIREGGQGIRPVAGKVRVKFTKVSRLDKLDSSSKLQIRQLEKLAEAKTLQPEKIIQGWKNLNKKLLDKKILLQEDAVKESFNRLIQEAKSQAQLCQKKAAFASEAERRMDKELKRAKRYLKQIRVSRTANKTFPPLRVKIYTGLVNRIKAGQVNIQWDPGEKPISSESELSDYIEEVETQMEDVRNGRTRTMTEFENVNQKANQLFNLLATVMKGIHEMQLALTRNLL
jgi:hypothetical protein